jgi:serine phosphatase RsbU (regulator of sigma subunit)/pSer/pThr/pTyr-binding forkhead associated (FHA) protein
MYVLAGTVGDRFVKRFLDRGRHRIGRGIRNDFDLDERSVSREHAELLIDEQRVRVQDLGSSNGTWVNGKRVTGAVDLQAGDEIRFGSVTFTLLDADQAKQGVSNNSETDPDLTVALLSDQNEVSSGERLAWDGSRDALDLPSVFDQVLFRAVTEAGQLLVLPRPLPETFDQVLKLVEQVIPARRILLLLTDSPDGTPVIRAARPRATVKDEKLVLSQTIVGTVLRDRQALLLNDAQSDPRFAAQDSVLRQNLRCAMVAPLFDNEQVIGLLYADSDDMRFRYDRNQLRAFSLLANLIAVKISNTRLLEAQREKERIEQEVAAAAQVQQGLLAGRQPFLPGYEVLARQIPCFEVAGDLYDVTQLADGRIALVVGDVTGKGIGAAMLMASIISALRVLYHECPEPSLIADKLHRQILRSADDIHFATLFLGLLDPTTHQLTYVNAGHDPPLILCGRQECRRLAATGMPMGLVPGATYRVETEELPIGSLLCVFTDGIPEAMAQDEFYGQERLLESVTKRIQNPLPEIVDGVIWDLRAFLGDHVLQDDVTMLLLRRQD